MAISFTRYIDITSGVGAANAVPQRQLIARLFTDNPLLPPQSYIEFDTALEVGSYFGTTSNEYFRALYYFSFISKNITSPQTISFARWVDTAQAAMIFGLAGGQSFATYSSISSGSLGLTIAGVHNNLSSLDFTGAVNLAGVASVIQAAIQAETGSGAQWTGATVVYSAANGGSFIFTSGSAVAATISVQAGVGGTDISALIGWLPEATFVQGVFTAGSIVAPGSAVEDIATSVSNASAVSNNYGSFAFITSVPPTLAQNIEVANWNEAQNVMFIFSVAVTSANASAWSNDVTGLGAIGGTGLTLNVSPTTQTGTVASASATITAMTSTAGLAVGNVITGTNIPAATVISSIVSSTSITISNAATGSGSETLTIYPNQYPEMLPMAIFASTNYEAVNAVQNYEFQISAGLIPTVTTDTAANSMDADSINYYGQTQTAGQLLSFYQQGVLLGIATDPLDMNTYANEIWLKDAAGAALMSLFLALAQVPANKQGALQITTVLQSVIDLALLNGTISVGKPLNTTQQQYIGQITGDPTAWHQVQNSGYWLNVVIQVIPNVTPIRYQAVYTLIYSKDDIIRNVVGTHDLI